MVINESKTKIIHISGRKKRIPPTVSINGNLIEVTSSAKLLGVIIQDDLKWNSQVEAAIKSSTKLIFPIIALQRLGCNNNILITLFNAFIRSRLTYAFPCVCNMSEYLYNNMVKVESRFNKIINSKQNMCFDKFCTKVCLNLKKSIMEYEDHPLRQLFLPINKNNNLRSQSQLIVPSGKTTLYINSFIKYFL